MIIKNLTVTDHCKMRMRDRKINKKQILSVLNNGFARPLRQRNYWRYWFNNIHVIINLHDNTIRTVYNGPKDLSKKYDDLLKKEYLNKEEETV